MQNQTDNFTFIHASFLMLNIQNGIRQFVDFCAKVNKWDAHLVEPFSYKKAQTEACAKPRRGGYGIGAGERWSCGFFGTFKIIKKRLHCFNAWVLCFAITDLYKRSVRYAGFFRYSLQITALTNPYLNEI